MVLEALEQAIDQVGSQLSRKELELQLEVADRLPPVGLAADSLRRISVILIENAIQASPNRTQVRVVAVRRDPQWVDLSVGDAGDGIPPEELGRTFQPELLSGGELAQVRQLAESAGGRMWIESELGAGTTITVRIPVVEESRGAGS